MKENKLVQQTENF